MLVKCFKPYGNKKNRKIFFNGIMTDGFFHRIHFSMRTQLRFQFFLVDEVAFMLTTMITGFSWTSRVRWLTIVAGDFSGAWFFHRIRLRNQNADHALAEDFTKLKIYAPWAEHKIGIYTPKLQCVNGAGMWLRNCTQNAHMMEWRNHNLKSHDGAKSRSHCFFVRIFLTRKCILMHPSVNFLQITRWQMVMTRGFCWT